MLPELERSFPDHTIVVRPHPTENHDVYREIAARCQRVRVTNEGNVVPWLLCAKALVHNGCTTGVEAFVMRIPAVSFRASVNELYDSGFYRLPNALSHQCFTFEALRETLRQILEGTLGAPDGDNQRRILQQHLAGQDGPLACERVVDVLDEIATDQSNSAAFGLSRRIECWAITKGLGLLRRIKSRLPGSHNRPEFQRHRYPGIPIEELRSRLTRFQHLLGDRTRLEVEPVTATLYRLRVA